MAFSKATLFSRVRRILNDNPFTDQITAAVTTAGQTTLTVADSTKYAVGSVVEFQDDGDQCLVSAVPTATTLTVVRSHNGTTASTHTNGTAMVLDPVFQYIQIEQSIDAALRGLWPYVYKVETATVTPVSGTRYYNLSATILELSSVVQMDTNTPARPFFYGVQKNSYPVAVVHGLPTGSFAAGQAVYIPYFKNTTNSVQVNGIARITATVATSNYSDFSDGLEADCVTYYTVSRLISETDVPRLTQEDITMGDETVQPLSRTKLAAYWEGKAIQERNKWKMYLDVTLPRIRRTVDYSNRAVR